MAKKKYSKSQIQKSVKGYDANKQGTFVNDAYVKKNFSYPNQDTAPDNKDSVEYMLPWAKYIYSLFQKKSTWMGAGFNDIDLMRSYMEGNQPVDQYRDFLYGKKNNNNQRVIDGDGYDMRGQISEEVADRMAWVNIDESPISIGPKIMTKVIEQARSMYYETAVNAIDSISVQKEEMEKARLWFEKENQEWLKQQRAMIGISGQEPEFMPINEKELELYASTGGFKVPYAVNMELLIQHTFDVSEWEKEVLEKILKDLASIRYALVKEYYDPEEKRIKVRYVDPKYGGLQYSRDFSYKNSEYGYELEFWPISKVRQKFNLSHEDAAGLAYFYSGRYNNPNIGEWDEYGYFDDVTGSLGFDFYRIPTFVFQFIDIDNEKYYKYTSKNGREFTKLLKNKDPEGLEVFDNKIRYVREGTWVVGTDLMADFGKVKYMVRNNPKKPRLSYRGIRLGVPALFRQIKPLLNGLNLAWWKTQQAISIAISNGIAVDVGALKNISIGKDKSWDVTKVLSYYRQQAILLYKRSNPLNFAAMGGGHRPIDPLVTKMYENIKVQFEIMDKFMQEIEFISGINLVATGNTPEPRTGKYNMQIALQGTNQIIGSVIRASTEIQSDVAINVAYRIKSLIRQNKKIRDSYSEVIGDAKIKVIEMAEKDNVQYGIAIEARDVTEMKAFIEQIIQESLKARTADGSSGLLDPSEAIIVRDMIEQKQNLRFISLTLGYMLRKKGKEAEAAQLKKIELQGDQIAKVEQQKEKNKKNERMFELVKIQKEFESEFTIKFGKPPSPEIFKGLQAPMPQPGIEGAPDTPGVGQPQELQQAQQEQ